MKKRAKQHKTSKELSADVGRVKELRSSPTALLKFFDSAPQCTAGDVDLLLQAIEGGKRPARFDGVFDNSYAV